MLDFMRAGKIGHWLREGHPGGFGGVGGWGWGGVAGSQKSGPRGLDAWLVEPFSDGFLRQLPC